MNETRIVAILALGAALVAAACGGAASASSASSGSSPTVASALATRVAVSLSDKDITLDQASVGAGRVTFAVKNAGSVVHSMFVIKTNLDETKIPADPTDRTKVDLGGSVGTTGQLRAGETKDLTLDLAGGRYVLVCNEPAHYMVGMHIAFAVK